jgi:hypothetical protein
MLACEARCGFQISEVDILLMTHPLVDLVAIAESNQQRLTNFQPQNLRSSSLPLHKLPWDPRTLHSSISTRMHQALSTYPPEWGYRQDSPTLGGTSRAW